MQILMELIGALVLLGILYVGLGTIQKFINRKGDKNESV